MYLQGRQFNDGQLAIYKDYKTASSAGIIGTFQVANICIDEESIINDLSIDQGYHYHSMKEVFEDLTPDVPFDQIEEYEV